MRLRGNNLIIEKRQKTNAEDTEAQRAAEKYRELRNAEKMRRTTKNQIAQASSLKRVEARRYMRRQTRRLISTTTTAMTSVEASKRSKRPESLALAMVLPKPAVETMRPWK